MKPDILKFINTIHPLPADILDEVLQHFQHLEYPKNYFLLKHGKPCKHLWFLTKGAVRYFNKKGDLAN